jgi:Diguanylate cyclase, GGDEF domain
VVAERLRKTVRADDIVGRIGGDEFLVVCPGVQAAEETMNLGRRIADALLGSKSPSPRQPSSCEPASAWHGPRRRTPTPTLWSGRQTRPCTSRSVKTWGDRCCITHRCAGRRALSLIHRCERRPEVLPARRPSGRMTSGRGSLSCKGAGASHPGGSRGVRRRPRPGAAEPATPTTPGACGNAPRSSPALPSTSPPSDRQRVADARWRAWPLLDSACV